MVFKYFKTFVKDSLGAGSKYSETWYPDEDILIKRIYIINKDGSAFTDSEFYLKVKETVYTLSIVPAVVLGPDVMSTPELNIPVAAKQVVALEFTNNEAGTVSLYIVLECWTP